MKTVTLFVILSASLFAQAKPAADPANNSPAFQASNVFGVDAKGNEIAPASMTDKQRGDFWFAQYKVAQKQAEIATAKAEVKQTDKPPTPPSVMTDKQRGDFWFAHYKMAQKQTEIAIAKAEALEKSILDPLAKERENAGQAIVRTCAAVKLGATGDVECPVPPAAPPAKK